MTDRNNPSLRDLVRMLFWMTLARWAPERLKQRCVDWARLPDGALDE